jgi:hypothetical protein
MGNGLDVLSKIEVENVFGYTLKKYDSTKEFLNAFEPILKRLYELQDYDGGWNKNSIDNAVAVYFSKTDAIKSDFEAKKIVKITGSSVSIIGGVLSFTPFAPIGWGLLGLGSATNAVTDVVDLSDRSKQNAWETAKNTLQDFVDNPFQGTNFKVVYDSLMDTFTKIKTKVPQDDYSILLQGLGWNYFAFRKEGMSHDDAINELHVTLDLFRTQRYIISDDLKKGVGSAIQHIQNTIVPSCNSLLSAAGALAMLGLSAGISIGAITQGITIASATFSYAEAIAKGLLHIGNFATKTFNFLMNYGPAIAIVGGVASIVFDSMALAHIDETFKPYYEYGTTCKSLIDQYEVEYKKDNEVIREMIRFMVEKKDESGIS